MKKIKILFFLLVGWIGLNGQEYVPLLNEKLVWSVMDEKFIFIGDTLISEQSYKKLYFHKGIPEFTPDSLSYLAAMREDSIEKKVWLLWNGYEEEVLLYDFALNIGEQFTFRSPFYTLAGPIYLESPVPGREMTVATITSKVVNDISRIVLELRSDHEFPEYWIEGIGGDRGLIYAGALAILEVDGPYPYLLCVHEEGELIYQRNDPWGFTTNTCYAYPSTSIEHVAASNKPLRAFPTFFTENISVQIEAPVKFIEVYDSYGRLVTRIDVNESQLILNISTDDWAKGLYYLRTSRPRSNFSIKLIKL